ncbi:hypothetical protein FPOAC2_01082 [Fusarium poae]
MFVFKLKHTHNFQYLLIYDPTDYDVTMPQIGEAYKVHFVTTTANATSTANADGASEQPVSQEQTAEADNCSELWLSATRIGLQILYLDSKYQVLAVRAPVDKEAESGDDNASPVAVNIPVNFIVPEPQQAI